MFFLNIANSEKEACLSLHGYNVMYTAPKTT